MSGIEVGRARARPCAVVVPAAAASAATALVPAKFVDAHTGAGHRPRRHRNTTPAEESASLDYLTGPRCGVPRCRRGRVVVVGDAVRIRSSAATGSSVSRRACASALRHRHDPCDDHAAERLRDHAARPAESADRTGADGTEVTVLILPSPPTTRYQRRRRARARGRGRAHRRRWRDLHGPRGRPAARRRRRRSCSTRRPCRD